ncbi:MAG: InlB B-repeat-containing protein, partial [Dehalococcoidia bacterium]
MKMILSSRIYQYVKRFGPLLIVGVLVMGLASCDGSCGGTPVQYELTTSCSEGGDVIVSGEGTYADGTIVTIEAVPDECYEFVEWTGADVADPYSRITTVTMDEAKSITANFALLSYDLTIDSTNGGSVTAPGEDTFPYDCGTEVDLAAAAEEDYSFIEWSGDVDTIASINALTTTVTMMGDYSITANFELMPPGQFVLTASSTVGGSVNDPGEGNFPYDEGTVVDLTAEAEECYEFVNWTGGAVSNPNSPITTVTMDGAKNVTANFALLSYNLTADSTDGGEVSSPGEGTFAYNCGTVVDLTAEAAEGYSFVAWSGDVDTVANISAAETTIIINSTYSVTANFGLFTGGNGTAGDPYQITDWYSLDNLRNYLSSYFILMKDLDSNSAGYTELASTTANGEKGWEPIGNATENVGFTGSFDGQGHEICDLFVDRSGESDVGLFGLVGAAGVIKNVGVNGNVTGYNDAGALVGKNEGTVSNAYATGRVTGNDYVGGLVGK